MQVHYPLVVFPNLIYTKFTTFGATRRTFRDPDKSITPSCIAQTKGELLITRGEVIFRLPERLGITEQHASSVLFYLFIILFF